MNDNMTILDTALKLSKCVVSVMGEHAGESIDVIFDRKKADIKRLNVTYWLMRSPKARPTQVQELNETVPKYTIFVEPSTKGGARPTTEDLTATEYSSDGKIWNKFPKDLGRVTGKMDRSSTALVFDMMTTDVKGILDFWDYGDAIEINKPLKFILGCSTVCAIKKDTKSHPERMKSHYRGIIAVARFAYPYCVWVR